MKRLDLWMLNILAAAAIITVLGYEGHIEREGVERANRDHIAVRFTYDGGWMRPLAMALAAGIIGLQIYSRILAAKMRRTELGDSGTAIAGSKNPSKAEMATPRKPSE
jgi:hypothetical protein